ncbi:MAG: hypothetical protein M1834_009609 [Cirrosporium novae-zelandiae]|nr:MAG: hypothetical protein M1834_009609 [Cirrosporium novae-zelandiae]
MVSKNTLIIAIAASVGGFCLLSVFICTTVICFRRRRGQNNEKKVPDIETPTRKLTVKRGRVVSHNETTSWGQDSFGRFSLRGFTRAISPMPKSPSNKSFTRLAADQPSPRRPSYKSDHEPTTPAAPAPAVVSEVSSEDPGPGLSPVKSKYSVETTELYPLVERLQSIRELAENSPDHSPRIHFESPWDRRPKSSVSTASSMPSPRTVTPAKLRESRRGSHPKVDKPHIPLEKSRLSESGWPNDSFLLSPTTPTTITAPKARQSRNSGRDSLGNRQTFYRDSQSSVDVPYNEPPSAKSTGSDQRDAISIITTPPNEDGNRMSRNTFRSFTSDISSTCTIKQAYPISLENRPKSTWLLEKELPPLPIAKARSLKVNPNHRRARSLATRGTYLSPAPEEIPVPLRGEKNFI